MAPPFRKRRWYQFNLLTMLVLMTLFAIPLARAGYLRRMAAFHRRELKRLSAFEFPRIGENEPKFAIGELDRQLDFHQAAAEAYDAASYRPWRFVQVTESPPTSPSGEAIREYHTWRTEKPAK